MRAVPLLMAAIVSIGLSVPAFAQAPLSPVQEQSLKPGDTFKECDVCPEMVVVPAGAFIMGSPQSETGRNVCRAAGAVVA